MERTRVMHVQNAVHVPPARCQRQQERGACLPITVARAPHANAPSRRPVSFSTRLQGARGRCELCGSGFCEYRVARSRAVAHSSMQQGAGYPPC